VKADLGVQGIGSADSAKQGEARKQRLSDRDLVRFLADLDLEQRFVTLVRTEREQMRRMLSGCPSATHRFAIESERIFWRSLQGGSYPVGKRIFDLLRI
jgi:hypothetical protein